MKRIVLMMIFIIIGVNYALSEKTHIVQRGESIESISKNYKISKNDLIEANPGIETLFYVGLKLNIPESKNTNLSTSNSNLNDAVHPANNTPKNSNMEEGKVYQNNSFSTKQNELTPLDISIYAGASLNSYTGDDFDDGEMKVGFNLGLTCRYFLYKDFFGEISLGFATKGYKKNMTATSGQYWDDYGNNYDSETNKNMTTYNLDIPLSIGYQFPIGNMSDLCIKVGPYLTYALSGKEKTTGYMKIYPDIHSSETEYINEEKKISEIDEYKKFGAGIGFGISYKLKNCSITISYQRGLTKIYEEQDIFEQNISLSLGYNF